MKMNAPVESWERQIDQRAQLRVPSPRLEYRPVEERARDFNEARLGYMPNIFKVGLGKDFHNASVGELVDTITPDIYRKFEGEHIQFDPKTPWGLIALLKDFGTPLARIIAAQIKVDENFRKKVLSEQAKLDAIKNYFESR